jgi:hypothetical protein
MSFTIKNSDGSPFVTGDFSIDNSSGTPFVVGNSVDNSAGTPFVITYSAILDIVSETLSALGAVSGGLAYNSLVDDAVVILIDNIDEETYRIRVVSETLSITDSLLEPILGKKVTDSIILESTLLHNGIHWSTIAETIELSVVLKLAFESLVSDSMELTASAILDHQFMGRVRDICSFLDTSVSMAKVAAALSVIFELMDTQSLSFAGALSETLSLVATESDKVAYRAESIDTLSMVGSTSATAGIVAIVSDDAVLTDSLESMGLLQALVNDEIQFRISFYDGRETYSGWVVNAHNFAVTEYTNYEFNSFAKIGGNYFAAGPNGLYQLHSADADDGVDIDAVLRTGKLNVGDGHQSRVEHAYLGVQSDGQLLLKTVTGDEKVRWYKSGTPKTGLDNIRIKLGRGVKSAYWQFEIANIDGQDLEVENMQFFPVILSRRV